MQCFASHWIPLMKILCHRTWLSLVMTCCLFNAKTLTDSLPMEDIYFNYLRLQERSQNLVSHFVIYKTWSEINDSGKILQENTYDSLITTHSVCWWTSIMRCLDDLQVHQNILKFQELVSNIEGNLPKGSYRPCVSMVGRALLAGYPRHMVSVSEC